MRYSLKYSGARFCPLKIKITQLLLNFQMDSVLTSLIRTLRCQPFAAISLNFPDVKMTPCRGLQCRSILTGAGKV